MIEAAAQMLPKSSMPDVELAFEERVRRERALGLVCAEVREVLRAALEQLRAQRVAVEVAHRHARCVERGQRVLTRRRPSEFDARSVRRRRS